MEKLRGELFGRPRRCIVLYHITKKTVCVYIYIYTHKHTLHKYSILGVYVIVHKKTKHTKIRNDITTSVYYVIVCHSMVCYVISWYVIICYILH